MNKLQFWIYFLLYSGLLLGAGYYGGMLDERGRSLDSVSAEVLDIRTRGLVEENHRLRQIDKKLTERMITLEMKFIELEVINLRAMGATKIRREDLL